jgi:lipopolysaccharide transport system permease protein
MENDKTSLKIITAEPDTLITYIKKIWQYKSLIFVFAKRDLKVKHSQTWLGLGWTILQPLTALVIFTFFFGYLLHWKSEGLPYSLYVLSGLLGWNFFSYVVFQGTSSIQESSPIIKKIYFPKAILPLSKVLVSIVELLINFLLLIPLLLWYEQSLSWHIILLPLVLLFNALVALFIVFTVASLAYRKHDLFHIVPFLMYFGIWCTPVFFTKNILPHEINFIWFYNPMAAIVELWRWCLFPAWSYNLNFVPALLVTIPLFMVGFSMYIKYENQFSDFA